MTPKIQSILYASDLSENSKPALAFAMMLAQQHDAKITFLHVLESESPGTSHTIRSFMGEEQWVQMVETYSENANAKIRERIQRFCEDTQTTMTDCRHAMDNIVVKWGLPVEVILEEAQGRDCDLIVMGTHGGGLFKDAMIGSTARRVLRRSTIPALVIPLSTA